MQRIGSSSLSSLVTTTMLLGGGAGAVRAYSPKVSTLDRRQGEMIADRQAIYARKRILKGKTIFPGQVLERPKEPTSLLTRMELDKEHEEDAMRSKQAIMNSSSSPQKYNDAPSASLELGDWVKTIVEVHRRRSPSHQALPNPPKSAPSKGLILASLKCVLTPPGAHDSEGYGSKDVMWSWVVVLTHQEECIRVLSSSMTQGVELPAERLIAALEAVLTSPHSLIMSKLATSSSKGVIPVCVAVPLAYMLSFSSPSTQSAIGCTLFESRAVLYERCKERIVDAARPGSEEIPCHPLCLIAIASCFTGKAVQQVWKDTISAFVLTQLRSLCTVQDPQHKIALLLASWELPRYAIQIHTALVGLGIPSARSLPLMATLCSSASFAHAADPLLELSSLLLLCPETRERGQTFTLKCLRTKAKPTPQSLLGVLVAMESVPRTAESDALVLITLRKLLGVRSAPFTVEECKTVYDASWRVGEIPRNLLTVIERDWSKDPTSATSIKRLQMLAA